MEGALEYHHLGRGVAAVVAELAGDLQCRFIGFQSAIAEEDIGNPESSHSLSANCSCSGTR